MKHSTLLIIDTLAELKTADGFFNDHVALVKGGASTGDGFQGLYRFDITSTETADNDRVVAVTGQDVGRWLRILPEFESVSGTLGSPSSGTLSASHERVGGGLIRSTFALTAAQIPVTDAAASGSYGTLKLFTFPEGGISHLGSRQNYTAFAEGAALTGAAGDAVFEIGLGTAAIAAAADGVLAATNDDIGGDVNVTLSGGTGTGTAMTGSGTAADGSSTAATLNLNWSGTAATIDASSTIDVTGTITVLWAMMGDD